MQLSALFLVPLALASAPTFASANKVQEIAKETSELISEVREAVKEASPRHNNANEICFRVGSLYQTLRHELDEARMEMNLSPKQKKLANQLIADAKSLPSFCGDKEKATNDPGYESVPEGDLSDLQRELTNIDARARQLRITR